MSQSTEVFIVHRQEIAGFSLREAHFPYAMRTEPYWRDQDNICMALKGSCIETYRKKAWRYLPLSFGFLPAGESHDLIIEKAGLHCFGMSIAPEWIQRANEFSLRYDGFFHCHGGVVAELLRRLHREFRFPDAAAALAIEAVSLEILVELSRRRVTPADRQPPRWLQCAKNALHSEASETRNMSDLAAAVGVHPVHLAREFRKHFGCTVGEYLRRIRLERSRCQLETSGMSLADIALVAGFSDQSHFTRTFKRHFGVTPSAYRINFQ